ncbi:isochorismate synthase [filamentous cyanobacterium LEGE 11480]|uniref:Isochorismate synthase n=1 Tax=Romeriopsis navalis LEGE 11480 TaxID=2777977 RepID=A0A928VL27_9CYAN|nr:isochorismate synthase [Romeriopsis navalis LEGE 11480]
MVSWFTAAFSFISDGISRIFSLTNDEYPATGIQPYSGDPAAGH